MRVGTFSRLCKHYWEAEQVYSYSRGMECADCMLRRLNRRASAAQRSKEGE